jgi:hypothetical protein
MKKVFNLTFDNWDNETPIPNLKKDYPKIHLVDSNGLILHYMDDTSLDKELRFTKKSCKLEEVYENPNQNYYYIIGYGGNSMMEFFFDTGDYNLYTLKKDPFNETIKNMLKNCNNFFIMFLTEHEPDSEESFKYLNDYLIQNNISGNKVHVINNNYFLNDYKVKLNSTMNVHSLQFIAHSSTKVITRIGGCKFIPNKGGKFFMMYNKSPKVHRYSLLCLLKNGGLLDQINWSLVPTWNVNPEISFYRTLLTKDQIEKIKNEIEYFRGVDIKRSDFEEDKGWFNPFQQINNKDLPNWQQVPEDIKSYESSYINIITESVFLDKSNSIHISEKSFRPFFYYQIPIIVGSFNHVKKMKERYGFDFFDDIIDHSYDNEPNQNKRIYMVYDEIVRLNENKDKIIEFYKNNINRFESNKQKVTDLLKVVDKDYLFFESLI